MRHEPVLPLWSEAGIQQKLGGWRKSAAMELMGQALPHHPWGTEVCLSLLSWMFGVVVEVGRDLMDNCQRQWGILFRSTQVRKKPVEARMKERVRPLHLMFPSLES